MTVLGQPTVNYTYDNADRLTQITQGSATVTIAYDNANRRTSLTLPNGVVTEYAYDAASRLTNLTYKLGGTPLGALTYTYDANGNRTILGGTWARTGLPTALASATYNAANHQVTFGTTTLTYDLNGNLTSDGTNTYTWDARNRLVSMSGGSAASFQYDAQGRRTSKTVNAAQTGFLYDGLTPVQELNGSSVVANLLAGLGIDEYLSRADTGGVNHFLSDALGSTIALTDSIGAVPTSYTYAPFGATSLSGSTTGSAFDYTGRENDGTGLKYYRARYYHPGLQRFVSEDPIGFHGGDANLYSYVFNDPIALRDPTGLEPITVTATTLAIACGVGAAIGDVAVVAMYGRKTTWSHLAWGAGAGCTGGLIGLAAGVAFIGSAAAATTGTVAAEAAAGGYLVYQAVTNGAVVYVGITTSLPGRAAAHLREKSIEIAAIPGLSNLPRASARGVEQALIEMHGLAKAGGTLMNKINSIAASNPLYREAVARGRQLLQQVGYE